MKLHLRIIPNAKANEIVGFENGAWKIRLHAPPIEGRANEALIEFLAEVCDCSKSEVTIVKGIGSREKNSCGAGVRGFPADGEELTSRRFFVEILAARKQNTEDAMTEPFTFEDVTGMINAAVSDAAELAKLASSLGLKVKPYVGRRVCDDTLLTGHLSGRATEATGTIRVYREGHLHEDNGASTSWEAEIHFDRALSKRASRDMILQSRFYRGEKTPRRVLYLDERLEGCLRHYFGMNDPINDALQLSDGVLRQWPAVRLQDHDRYLAVATRMFQLLDDPPQMLLNAVRG